MKSMQHYSVWTKTLYGQLWDEKVPVTVMLCPIRMHEVCYRVIPPTAARMGVNPKNLYDPEQNIIAGTRYLRFLCNHFPDKSSPHGCNIDLVLAGYNAGEGAVRKYGGIPPYRETQHYVRNVKERYARLSGNRTVLASHPVQPLNRSLYLLLPDLTARLKT